MRRILFVDDESHILAGLARSLRSLRHEWETSFAEGGAAALAQCAAAPFDAVVSDARMPGMEGSALLGEVRRLYPDTIRIILSGQCSRASVLACVGVAHQFLSKPCDLAILKAAVQRACEMRDAFPDRAVRMAIGSVQWLPSQMSVRDELAAAVDSERAPLEQVAEIVARDVAMSAKVVQLVSSGFFGTPQRVASAAHAATLLGLDTLKALWASSGDCPQRAADDRQRALSLLTEHSVAVATAAERIARTMSDDRTLAGDAYLAGMLHEVGPLALGAVDRCAAGAAGPDPGGYLAALWGLPDAVVEAIAYRAVPGSRPQRALSPLTAVHIAHALVAPPAGWADDGGGRLDMEYLCEVGCRDYLQQWRELCAACKLERVSA